MHPSRLHSSVEALLFASDQPLTLALLAEALEAPIEDVSEAMRELGEEYAQREAGVRLREMAGGWLFMTAPEQNEFVTRMLRGKRKARLSRAALETLAIIAYKQPVTKGEMEAIRGVDCSGTLATLLERDLVTIKGRSTVVGRPLLYGTSPGFLDYFGLNELAELPRPEELRALIAARDPEQMEMLELEPASGLPLALSAAILGAAAGEPVMAEDAASHEIPDSESPSAIEAQDEETDDESIESADEALLEAGYRARAKAHEEVDFIEEGGAAMGADLAASDEDDVLEFSDDDDEADDVDEDDDEDFDDDLDSDDDDDDDDEEHEDEDDERSDMVLGSPEGGGR